MLCGIRVQRQLLPSSPGPECGLSVAQRFKINLGGDQGMVVGTIFEESSMRVDRHWRSATFGEESRPPVTYRSAPFAVTLRYALFVVADTRKELRSVQVSLSSFRRRIPVSFLSISLCSWDISTRVPTRSCRPLHVAYICRQACVSDVFHGTCSEAAILLSSPGPECGCCVAQRSPSN